MHRAFMQDYTTKRPIASRFLAPRSPRGRDQLAATCDHHLADNHTARKPAVTTLVRHFLYIFAASPFLLIAFT